MRMLRLVTSPQSLTPATDSWLTQKPLRPKSTLSRRLIKELKTPQNTQTHAILKKRQLGIPASLNISICSLVLYSGMKINNNTFCCADSWQEPWRSREGSSRFNAAAWWGALIAGLPGAGNQSSRAAPELLGSGKPGSPSPVFSLHPPFPSLTPSLDGLCNYAALARVAWSLAN